LGRLSRDASPSLRTCCHPSLSTWWRLPRRYLSIQRGRRSELRGSGTAWHCFETNQSKCPAKPKSASDERLEVNVRDAGFFVVEALRLHKQANRFSPEFVSTFEECVSNATGCVNTIYATLGLPPRTKPVLAARVSSSLSVVNNLDELLETLADIKLGNWTPGGRKKRAQRALNQARRWLNGSMPAGGGGRGGGGKGGKGGVGKGGSEWTEKAKERKAAKAAAPPKPRRNVSFDEAVAKARERFGGAVHVGEERCPRVRLLDHPAYQLYAQIHRNRLAGMLVSPRVLGSLSLICVIGSQPETSAGTYGLRGQVSAGDEVWYSSGPFMDALLLEEFEMPAVLRKLRHEGRKAAASKRAQVVLYSNPRGANPTGVDTCTSYREMEKGAWHGSGSISWSEAGVLDDGLPLNSTRLVLRPPALLMAGRYAALERPVCVVAPSHPIGGARRGSVCHVDAYSKPPTGWTKAHRNLFYFTSLLRVDDEVMVVLDVSVGKTRDGSGDACHLTVRREADGAVAHSAGGHALAPTHLDAEASAATCEAPVQYAFDYSSPAAASCIERHLEHALAVGADGTWLDNMGPNQYGAKTATGLLLGSYDLRHPTASEPEPCGRELAAADLEGADDLVGDAQRDRETAIYRFKLCRFSAMVRAQGARAAAAAAAIHRILGRKPLVVGNGLKHSFYWTGKDASQVRGLYKRVHPELGRDDPRPFAPNVSENVIYYRVRGTRELMQRPDGPLDGFNMESFFGFIEVRHQCANWPIGQIDNPSRKRQGERPSLASCEAQLDHPATHFWHANVRVFASAGQRGLRALAKVGQAGWKTVGQEYLPPDALHRWSLGAYASFLFTVAKSNTLSLGVHPFAQTAHGVQPWLHPVFFLDVGKPEQTEELLEFYRVPGHSTYARRFENGITLYNPEAAPDADVPLGAEYVDPFDRACAARRTYSLEGQSGAVLLKRERVLGEE
jgi:hypothetical protein